MLCAAYTPCLILIRIGESRRTSMISIARDNGREREASNKLLHGQSGPIPSWQIVQDVFCLRLRHTIPKMLRQHLSLAETWFCWSLKTLSINRVWRTSRRRMRYWQRLKQIRRRTVERIKEYRQQVRQQARQATNCSQVTKPEYKSRPSPG